MQGLLLQLADGFSFLEEDATNSFARTHQNSAQSGMPPSSASEVEPAAYYTKTEISKYNAVFPQKGWKEVQTSHLIPNYRVIPAAQTPPQSLVTAIDLFNRRVCWLPSNKFGPFLCEKEATILHLALLPPCPSDKQLQASLFSLADTTPDVVGRRQ